MKWILILIAATTSLAQAQEVHFPDGLKLGHFHDSVLVPLSGDSFVLVAIRYKKRSIVQAWYSAQENVMVLPKANKNRDIIGMKSRNQLSIWSRLPKKWYYPAWREQFERLGNTNHFPN